MTIATTRFLLVGGFLGAGKTTLLSQAAARLSARGFRVALLANDQAADLVDTAVLEESGAEVDEVSGGCFCCRFDDMLSAIERLKARAQPDYIIAEPVGSCTDLSATVLQPLKQMHGREVELGPFSVLIDVKQARLLLRLGRQARTGGDGFPDDVLYIYRKQVEEADVIVLNKTDLVAPGDLEELRSSLAAEFPDAPIVAISAISGEGVDAWLDLLSQGQPVGRKIAEVDYDTYAAGEAALGWMNASAKLTWSGGLRGAGDEDRIPEPGRVGPVSRQEARGEANGPHPNPLPKGEGTDRGPLPKGEGTSGIDWTSLARQLLETVRAGIVQAGGQIGHLKLYLTRPGGGHVAGNVTSNDGPVALRGDLPPDAREVSLLLNARVRVHADRLREIAEASLQAVAAQSGVAASISNMRSFFPSRPVPKHRYSSSV